MSACRGLDVVMGSGAHGAPRALPAAAVVAAHIAVVTEVSRREVEGGDPSVGRRALAATAAVAGAARAAAAAGGWPPLGLLGAYAAVVGRAHADAARDPSPARLQRAVGAGILGLMPLEAGLLAGAGALVPGGGRRRRCGRWPAGPRRSGPSREPALRLRLQRAVRPPDRGRARAAGRERLRGRRADARPHPLRPVRAAAARARGAAAVRARRSSGSTAWWRPGRGSCSTRAASTSRRC